MIRDLGGKALIIILVSANSVTYEKPCSKRLTINLDMPNGRTPRMLRWCNSQVASCSAWAIEALSALFNIWPHKKCEAWIVGLLLDFQSESSLGKPSGRSGIKTLQLRQKNKPMWKPQQLVDRNCFSLWHIMSNRKHAVWNKKHAMWNTKHVICKHIPYFEKLRHVSWMEPWLRNLTEPNVSWMEPSLRNLSEPNVSWMEPSLRNLSEPNVSWMEPSLRNLSEPNISWMEPGLRNLSEPNVSWMEPGLRNLLPDPSSPAGRSEASTEGLGWGFDQVWKLQKSEASFAFVFRTWLGCISLLILLQVQNRPLGVSSNFLWVKDVEKRSAGQGSTLLSSKPSLCGAPATTSCSASQQFGKWTPSISLDLVKYSKWYNMLGKS